MSGGGGGGPDKEYNAGLLELMKVSSAQGAEMFDFWRSDYKPYQSALMWANTQLISPQLGLAKETLGKETAQQIYEHALLEPKYSLDLAKITAETGLTPQRAGLESAQISSAMELLPQQTALAGAQIADKMDIMRERKPVRQAFYSAALNGMDPEAQANRAAADAAQAFAGSSAAMSRSAARMGVNPNSGRFAAMDTGRAVQRAQAIGGARTQGRIQGEREKFARMQSAMGMGMAG